LPRRSIQSRTRRSEGTGRVYCRQAAQWSGGYGQPRIPARADEIRKPRGGHGGITRGVGHLMLSHLVAWSSAWSNATERIWSRSVLYLTEPQERRSSAISPWVNWRMYRSARWR